MHGDAREETLLALASINRDQGTSPKDDALFEGLKTYLAPMSPESQQITLEALGKLRNEALLASLKELTKPVSAAAVLSDRINRSVTQRFEELNSLFEGANSVRPVLAGFGSGLSDANRAAKYLAAAKAEAWITGHRENDKNPAFERLEARKLSDGGWGGVGQAVANALFGQRDTSASVAYRFQAVDGLTYQFLSPGGSPLNNYARLASSTGGNANALTEYRDPKTGRFRTVGEMNRYGWNALGLEVPGRADYSTVPLAGTISASEQFTARRGSGALVYRGETPLFGASSNQGETLFATVAREALPVRVENGKVNGPLRSFLGVPIERSPFDGTPRIREPDAVPTHEEPGSAPRFEFFNRLLAVVNGK